MLIKKLHSDFIMPTLGSEYAGAYDLYMPEAGSINGEPTKIHLGFASAIPNDHVALLLPRSSTGAKFSVELNNTCGVIDADYRGEWMAVLRTKDGSTYSWNKGDRVLQYLLVPVFRSTPVEVEDLPTTNRGAGGYGSSGK